MPSKEFNAALLQAVKAAEQAASKVLGHDEVIVAMVMLDAKNKSTGVIGNMRGLRDLMELAVLLVEQQGEESAEEVLQ